jgi:phosphoribosylformylglycinamidine cyclo-ligase
MRRTFNLGIGLVVIAAAKGVEKVVDALRKIGEQPVVIGEVMKT